MFATARKVVERARYEHLKYYLGSAVVAFFGPPVELFAGSPPFARRERFSRLSHILHLDWRGLSGKTAVYSNGGRGWEVSMDFVWKAGCGSTKALQLGQWEQYGSRS